MDVTNFIPTDAVHAINSAHGQLPGVTMHRAGVAVDTLSQASSDAPPQANSSNRDPHRELARRSPVRTDSTRDKAVTLADSGLDAVLGLTPVNDTPTTAVSGTHGNNDGLAVSGHLTGTMALPIMLTGLRTIRPSAGNEKISLKSSISPMESTKYLQECEAAAIASRLPPHHMSALESAVMREHLSHLQITTYVITRNAILRLWIKNPLLWVSVEEAQGVAREERHLLLCRQIWEFLMRNGYINFGCLDIPEVPFVERETKDIVVIGAGIAGLSAARQIQTLLAVFNDKLSYNYNVTVLEGRSRLGGRVYSHELQRPESQDGENQGVASRVDLGAQIVTGFSGGNPLTILLQRQLALPYHMLVRARNNKIHGHDGRPVPQMQDVKVEGLFNLLLDGAARFRDLLRIDNDYKFEHKTGKVASEEVETTTLSGDKPRMSPTHDKQEKANMQGLLLEPVDELRRLGFEIREDIAMEPVMGSSSLGQTMNNVLEAYSRIAYITSLDRDVLRWHWANMEYACGTNLDNLSLSHWDQDDGNEFRGHHAMMVGGYAQLARGLALAPSRLKIRTNAVVKKVTQSGLLLDTGESVTADKIVTTVSLGLLKSQALEYIPTLPEWKLRAIDRLGFGLLNKVVLVYEKQFWEEDIDLLGTLPSTTGSADGSDRGRFYMFWNCTAHASGRPVLIALMTGDSAIACESTSNEILVEEARGILSRIYPSIEVPHPQQSIVTRWGSDPFALGSYSYIGKNGSGEDYEALSRPIGDHWFFAGEATCRTHPSTVHGAYLSGLAAAKAILESIIGEQRISTDIPLVPIKVKPGFPSQSVSVKTESKKRKIGSLIEPSETVSVNKKDAPQSQKKRVTEEQEVVDKFILDKIGPRPVQPKKMNGNPFLIYQKDQWIACRDIADDVQRKKQNNSEAKATKNQIRACLGQTWRETPEQGRKYWVDIVQTRRAEYETARLHWEKEHAQWESNRAKILKNMENEARDGTGLGTVLPSSGVIETGSAPAK